MSKDAEEAEGIVTEGRNESAFEDEAQIGDLYFLVKSWPAWFVNPTNKGIAPITRLYVGDSRGRLIFSRNVTLGGMFDLSLEVMRTTTAQVELLADMKEFHIYVPEKKDQYLKMIENMNELLKIIKETFEKIEVRTPDDIEITEES